MTCIGPIGFTSWIPGIFSYIIAYYIGYLWNKKIKDKAVLTLTIVTICAVMVRLITKRFLDTSIVYDCIVAPYTQCIITFGIFFVIYWFCAKNENIQGRLYKLSTWTDTHSFEIYSSLCFYRGNLIPKTVNKIYSSKYDDSPFGHYVGCSMLKAHKRKNNKDNTLTG